MRGRKCTLYVRSPHRAALAPRRDTLVGQRVRALVARMPAVTLDPVPVHLVSLVLLVQVLPQVDILYRLPARGFPALVLPSLEPAGDAVAHIDGIGRQIYPAGFTERPESLDGGRQLHAIIGGFDFTSSQLPLMITRSQQRSPPPWPGIPAARSVSKDFNNRHLSGTSSRDCLEDTPRAPPITGLATGRPIIFAFTRLEGCSCT